MRQAIASPAGNPVIITTDTQAPTAPIVTTIDNNGTLVSGTAEKGSTVIIRNGTTVLGGPLLTALPAHTPSRFHRLRRRVKH